MNSIQHKYYGGTISSYSQSSGYGYIKPDETDIDLSGQILAHFKSFRDVNYVPEIGDRVLFITDNVQSGLVARDIHLREKDTAKDIDAAESAIGEIVYISPNQDYGFIRLPDRREAFYHIKFVVDKNTFLQLGAMVSCTLVYTEKGWQAQNIDKIAQSSETIADPNDLLAQALLARDQKRYDDAAKYYELGMSGKPSLALILSYAAMEKNRGNKLRAMDVYERAIKILPKSAKLKEDAGILAASLHRYNIAIDLLKQSLYLCRKDPEQRGEKGVLLGLARIYYILDDLKLTIHYYQQAVKAFGSEKDLQNTDSLSFNIAKIREKHHRGNLTIKFFQKNSSFQIIKAKLLEQDTVGADIIVKITNTEFLESYGFGQQILVRCFFKTDILQSDIEALDVTITKLGSTGQADEQVALVVVSSLPDYLQRTLFKRIEDLQGRSLSIIPITQQEIETGANDLNVLRSLLDKWLYRRDLFAANFPVVGSRFFGRDKSLSELRDAISTGVPIGIFGLRKVGKTSLLKEVERRSLEFGDIVVYLDLLRVPSDVTDAKWLYWRIAQILHEKIKQNPNIQIKWRLGGIFESYLDVPNGFPLVTAFDADLSSLLSAIRKLPLNPKPQIVLLMDEIERLLPNNLGMEGFKGFFDFFSYLRGTSQENNNFVVMVTGANASISEASQYDGRDNPVFNFFKETYLQLLELSETRVMLRELGKGMGIKFSSDAIEHIHRLAGGHPFFTRQLCSFLARIYTDRPLMVQKELVERILVQYLEQSGKDYQEILDRLQRDYPVERDACVILAHAGGKLPLRKFVEMIGQDRVSIKHLLGYQIVRVENDQVTISMDLFKRWLLKE